MTDSDVQVRPPDAPPAGPEWLPYPGAGYYEFSHRGKARSVDRWVNGKHYDATEPLATRPNNQGYVLVDIRMDTGEKKTVTMGPAVLRCHDREPEPWEECRHGPGGQQDNRWPENIQWGTRPANLADMAAARPPRPERTCPRCGQEHRGRGQNCPDCMTAIGVAGAGQLAEGKPLDRVSDDLSYPPAGVYRLAVTKGGLHVHVGPCAATRGEPVEVVPLEPHAVGYRASHRGWLRRVINRAGASRQGSDAQ
jgi:hypothetical protein